METIDLTPSWRTAVAIYVEALIQTTDRYSEAATAAREDLMKLARIVDNDNDRKSGMSDVTIDPAQLVIQFGGDV